ncbi:MAG: alkaline phosphatase family protein [Acidimicrobiales bacterium]
MASSRTTRAGVALVAALLLAAVPAWSARGAALQEESSIGHVFVIVLENKGFATTFGPNSAAPYLSKELAGQGQLLTQYHGIGHVSLGNYIAMVSGQAPNSKTQSDCQVFLDFDPPRPTIDADGQAVGQGCVFPTSVPTVVDQLEQAGHTWRGYMEGMGTPCRHPDVDAPDLTQHATVANQYATRHNPFVYFHSIIDDEASCREQVVDLSALTDDLASDAATPNVSFISPDLCHDGHDTPCVDGQPGGLVSADAFLQQWVPPILASSAFQRDGLLIVTFDEAELGEADSAAACCGERPGPNSAAPGLVGPGGGRTGAVVVSRSITPGTVNDTPYNHYSLLRTIEDVFGLTHLGMAAADDLGPFGPDVFNAPPAATASSSASRSTSEAANPKSRSGVEAGIWLVIAGAIVAAIAGAGLAARRARSRR